MPTFATRYVALKRETAYGGGTGSNTAYGEVDDESMSHNFDILTRSDMSRFGAAKSINGKEYSEGGLNFAIQCDDFAALCFWGIYGADTATPATPVDKHLLTEAVASTLPSFEISIGRDDNEHTYSGCAVSRLAISASIGEYVTMSVDFVGKAESAIGSLATPTFGGATLDAVAFDTCAVHFNNDATASDYVKSISIEWNTNLDTDNACALGNSTYIRQPPMQMREITGSVEFTRIILDAAGAPTSPAQQSEPAYDDLIAVNGLEFNADAAATDTAIKMVLTDVDSNVVTIELFKVRWEAPDSSVSGRDSQTETLNFTALYDADGSNPAGAMSQVTLDASAGVNVFTDVDLDVY